MTATHPRLRALLRLLLDAGEITPQGVRQIERVLEEEDDHVAALEKFKRDTLRANFDGGEP